MAGRSGTPRLVDRLRGRTWLGASWLARWGDAGFLLAVDATSDRLTITAIGGKVEADETFAQAANREWEEETGLAPPPQLTVPRPLWVGADPNRSVDTEGAGAILHAPPGKARHALPLWIAVFLTRFAEPPWPIEKHPAFVVVPPTELERSASTGEPPRFAEIIGELPVSRSEGVLFRDTPALLSAHAGALLDLWEQCGTGP